MLKRFRYQIATFVAVLGPGMITANVDNDAGGIYTYSQAGARWGYLPLWTLIPITIFPESTSRFSVGSRATDVSPTCKDLLRIISRKPMTSLARTTLCITSLRTSFPNT